MSEIHNSDNSTYSIYVNDYLFYKRLYSLNLSSHSKLEPKDYLIKIEVGRSTITINEIIDYSLVFTSF